MRHGEPSTRLINFKCFLRPAIKVLSVKIITISTKKQMKIDLFHRKVGQSAKKYQLYTSQLELSP